MMLEYVCVPSDPHGKRVVIAMDAGQVASILEDLGPGPGRPWLLAPGDAIVTNGVDRGKRVSDCRGR